MTHGRLQEGVIKSETSYRVKHEKTLRDNEEAVIAPETDSQSSEGSRTLREHRIAPN